MPWRTFLKSYNDEFIYSLNEMMLYCKEKGYLSGDISYEIDSIVRDIGET
jgi:hypothetical protein